MEEITKELNSATEYLRAMKKSGHHKGDCDNILMHLANIEDLVNKLFIANVSVSFIEQVKKQIEYHEEQETNRSKVKDYRQAIYHDNRRGALEDLLLWIKLNER